MIFISTEAGNFQFLSSFKELIGMDSLIESHFHLEQKANCVYSARKLVDHLLDRALLGHSRFQHMNAFQSDPGYPIVTGIERFPVVVQILKMPRISQYFS